MTTEFTRASDLIASLRDRAPKLAMAIAAGQLAWPAGKWLHAKARERHTYTVKVPSEDEVYDDVLEWVLTLLPPKQQRALVAWTVRRSNYVVSPVDEPRYTPPMRLRYDGSREQAIRVGDHKIRVVVSGGSDDGGKSTPPEIVFTAKSLDAQRHLLTEIGQVSNTGRQRNRKPVLKMRDWNDWRRIDDLPNRELNSVILAAGQLERIVDDVARFLASEQDYARRGMPWHHGHLYEGPPGTGKTSVALAIARHFNMDIWYLSLADMPTDQDLLRALTQIGPRSMLLLEDIDVFHAATQRKENASKATLSGLLNALDGIATPHGLLTVLTTNTPEVIDAAVIRSGRVDLSEHIGLADNDQISRLLTRWYAEPVSAPTELDAIAPAEIVDACKRYECHANAVADLVKRRPTVMQPTNGAQGIRK